MLSIIVTLLVIAFDQLSKFIVHNNMELGQSLVIIPGIFNITYIRNSGAAWGMLADKRWIFLSVSILAIMFVSFLLYKFRKDHPFMKVSLSLILGGGIGNMIDRIFFGEKLWNGTVIDFIEAAFIDFPVFNVADSCVCIGAALLFVYVIFIEGAISKRKTSKIDISSASQREDNIVSVESENSASDKGDTDAE